MKALYQALKTECLTHNKCSVNISYYFDNGDVHGNKLSI